MAVVTGDRSLNKHRSGRQWQILCTILVFCVSSFDDLRKLEDGEDKVDIGMEEEGEEDVDDGYVGEGADQLPTCVSFKGFHGKYLVAESDGNANANRNVASSWEKWTTIKQSDGKYSFKSFHGKYLVAESDGRLNANRNVASSWEKWDVAEVSGKRTFKSAHGKYMVAESDGNANANRGQARSWEQWEIISCEAATWELVFRQTYPTLYVAGEWSKNPSDPQNANFAILDQLEQYSSNGAFTFKLSWPASGLQDQMWRQTSNPVTKTDGGVEGYEAITVPYTSNGWGGLEYHTGSAALLDGTVDSGNWYYAVGSRKAWNNGFPGPSGAIQVVELYVQTKARCTCSSEGRKLNSVHGDWCYLREKRKPTSCAFLDGAKANQWTWTRCVWKGVVKVDCGQAAR